MQPARILVVDDQSDIRAMVKMVLTKAGYSTVEAANGAQAVEAARATQFDCVVMDVVMPVMDGLQACRSIREFSQTPVLLLSARGEEDDLIEGFNAGAYDYMIKPFRPRELVARVQMHIQRAAEAAAAAAEAATAAAAEAVTAAGSPERLSFDDLSLDLRAQQIYVAGQAVDVTTTSLRLLEHFMLRPGVVISKDELLRDIWNFAAPLKGDNMVEAAIKRLRKDLRDDSRSPRYIKTVWGSGYRLG